MSQSDNNATGLARGRLSDERSRRASLAACVPAGAFLLVAAALILGGHDRGRAASDQNKYHLVAVRDFAQQWPAFDLRDYESATTPGYHILLATFARFISDDLAALRFFGAGFTLGLLAMLAWWTARRAGAALAIAAGLPLVASLYVVSSGAYLLPDNAGWWGVLAVVLLAWRPRFDARWLATGGVLMLCLVLVRQVHLWGAAVLWLAAWLGPRPAANPLWPPEAPARLQRTVLAALATAPAFAVMAGFYRLWGGTVPPMFQPRADHELAVNTVGGNPATPALILALIGAFGVFYAGFLWPMLRDLWRADGSVRRRACWFVGAAAAAALLIALAPHTTYDMPAGRWSGLWNLVRPLDQRGFVFAGRSPLIIALGTLGGVWLALWWLALAERGAEEPRSWADLLGGRRRWLWMGAWVAFTAAQSANHFSWQRYHEPFILMMLALAAAASAEGRGADGPVGRWPLVGPVVLAVLLGAVTVAGLG